MERPGFNPQAPAREPGSQRSGANKDKEDKAAQRAGRRAYAGGGKRRNESARSCHAE